MDETEAQQIHSELKSKLAELLELANTPSTQEKEATEERLAGEFRALSRVADELLMTAYGPLHNEISAILDRYDAIDLVAIAPPNEYWGEAREILLKLVSSEASSQEELRWTIYRTFAHSFSPDLAGPESKYDQIARDVWAAWQRHVSEA